MTMHRRRVLQLLGAVGATALAGCSGGQSAGSADTSARTETATTTPASSQYQGPTQEDNEVVDVQYRDFRDSEVEAIRDEAESVSHDELLRNIDQYTDQSVTFEAEIIQYLDGDGYAAVLFSFDGGPEDIAYGSWVGDRYITGDVVGVWAEVLGTETYETGMGGQRTVPAVAVAAMELQATAEE